MMKYSSHVIQVKRTECNNNNNNNKQTEKDKLK